MLDIWQKLKSHLYLLFKNRLDSSQEDERASKLKSARNQPWDEMEFLRLTPNVSIGRYTYGLTKKSIIRPTKEAPVTIGNFCSFAPGVVILAHADHSTEIVTTYPFKTLFCNFLNAENFDFEWTNHDAITKGPVNIGHDVWVGQNVLILSGVTIGNGAVIGAGSVVTKDIPSYAVAVGNPAKVIKLRFSIEMINALNKLEWWKFNDETIIELLPYLYTSPEKLIEHVRITSKR